MNTKGSVAATLAAVILGVIAVGMAMFGVFLPAVSLATLDLTGAAVLAIVMVGAVSVVGGIASGLAAWAVVEGRRVGAMTGLMIGAVLVLGPVVAAQSGGWHPALWVAVLMGAAEIAILAPMLASRSPGAPQER